MYALDNSSGVSVMPEIADQLSTGLFFTEGGDGQEPSYPGADWYNIVQSELLNVLSAAEVPPSKAKLNQLITAIKTLIRASVGSDKDAFISSSASLTIPISNRGSFYQFTGSAAATWELPTPVGNSGSKFTVWNNGIGTLALTTPVGYFYGSTISGQYASYGIPNGDVCVFESDGYNWINIVNTMVAPAGATVISSPASGDSSTKIATTAFVKGAMGSDKNAIISAASSLTLSISASGSFYQFIGTTAASWTLPTPVGNAGAKFTIWNNGTATLAATTPAGYFYGSTISGQYASYGISNGGVCVFESDGYNWININNTMVAPAGATVISAPALTDNSTKLITSGWLKSIFGSYSNKATSASASSLATSVSFTAPSNGVILLISQGYISGGSSQTLVGPTLTATNAAISNYLLNYNQAASQFGVATGLATVTAGAAVTITATMTNSAVGAANVQLIALFIPTA